VLRQEFEVETQAGVSRLQFDVKCLVAAGYTGRNRKDVLQHIEELSKLGVKPPEKVPAKYVLSPQQLTTKNKISVSGNSTSGEVEYVILIGPEIYIGIGSDHTDREIERSDVLESKRACPKLMGSKIWRLSDLEGHWDSLLLSSWIRKGGEEIPYQHSDLTSMMVPREVIREMDEKEEGTVIFSGTPTLLQETTYASHFREKLQDPILGRHIDHEYDVEVKIDR